MELKERRYDIDWLRVLAFYLLIFYHTGMLFVPWDFHIKNNLTSEWFESWMVFLSQWRLPLLFLISGVGVSYALGKRNANQFIKERTKRLFIPLVFGMFVIVPPQIYVERISNGVRYADYFDFWKTVFNFVPYPMGGSLSWHHLWYVLYIFIFSLIMLPLFLYLRGNKSVRIREAIAGFLKKKPNSIYLLLMVPIFIIYTSLARSFPTTHALIGDWYFLSYTLVFFLFGYLISTIDSFWETIVTKRKQSLIMALVPIIFLELFVWGPTFEIMNEDSEFFFYFYAILKSFLIAAWLLALLGYAKVYLNKPNRFIRYANESVYPLYILHQTVELIIACFIIKLDWGIIPKFLLVVVGTFGLSFIIYEVFIRRLNFMRFLFGMKSMEKQKIVHEEAVNKVPVHAEEGN
jgi:glucans biosynthesis protein C